MFGGQLSNPNPVVFDVPSDTARTSSSSYRGDAIQPDEIFGTHQRRCRCVNAAAELTKRRGWAVFRSRAPPDYIRDIKVALRLCSAVRRRDRPPSRTYFGPRAFYASIPAGPGAPVHAGAAQGGAAGPDLGGRNARRDSDPHRVHANGAALLAGDAHRCVAAAAPVAPIKLCLSALLMYRVPRSCAALCLRQKLSKVVDKPYKVRRQARR